MKGRGVCLQIIKLLPEIIYWKRRSYFDRINIMEDIKQKQLVWSYNSGYNFECSILLYVV